MMEDSHFNPSYFWSPVPTVQGQIDNAMFINKMKEQLVPEKSSFSHGGPAHYPTAVLTVPGSAVTMETTSGGAGRGSKQENHSIAGHLHTPHTTQNITVVPVPSTGIMTAAGLVITTPQGALVSSPANSGQAFSVAGVAGHHTTTMIVSALHPSSMPSSAGDKHKQQVSNEETGNSTSASQSSLQTGQQSSQTPTQMLAVHPVPLATPGKRGRKKKQLGRGALASSVVTGHGLTPGNEALILAHLAAGGQHSSTDPYDITNEDEDTGTGKDGNKSYRCRMCAVTFFSKSEMQLHSKSHTETKPHKCPHCSKTFANSSYLAQHIRIHSGAKPYTCSYCQKSFRQLSHLQQHTRIHTGDRPYKCVHPGCEKAFTQLSNLQSHRRQHNKDKPFKCHNCHRAYTDSASLEVHLATHTVKHAKVYSCGMCNRAYTSETYLMKHMRKHNPDPNTQVQPNQSNQNPTQQQAQNAQGQGQNNPPQSHYGQQNQSDPNPGQCPFDLHQYKTVTAQELQYKQVQSQQDHQHKDLCLTVSTSAIQVVDHLNS
uniref:Zinc finger protein 384 n=1 Tax=Erpetoichthys calabaricus TaxID=27687 RepID=A0A8C4XGC8_ERPCA